LNEKIQKLRSDSLELDQTIKNKEKELSLFQKKIDDFNGLIVNHRNIVNIFEIIERRTMPSMWFDGFSFTPGKDSAVSISGRTNSFFAVEQQIDVFEKDELIKEVELVSSSINQEDGVIEFSFRVVFDPKAFAFGESPVFDEIPPLQEELSPQEEE